MKESFRDRVVCLGIWAQGGRLLHFPAGNKTLQGEADMNFNTVQF